MLENVSKNRLPEIAAVGLLENGFRSAFDLMRFFIRIVNPDALRVRIAYDPGVRGGHQTPERRDVFADLTVRCEQAPPDILRLDGDRCRDQ